MLDRTSNPRAVAGGNNPPDSISLAGETIAALSAWMTDNPVVQTEEESREAKLLLDRAKSSLESMEIERDALVRPLNVQVKAINDRYRQPRTLLEKVRDAIAGRLTAYARRLEHERIAAAEAARRAAEEAERVAREAEAREREAAQEAAQGVCTDTVAATEEADQAFSRFKKADRQARRAERDTRIRIGGGFGKAASLRTVEILSVTDFKAAIDDIGLTQDIANAILKGARVYRKENGELPSGVAASYERTI
jgi:hypothetical protein